MTPLPSAGNARARLVSILAGLAARPAHVQTAAQALVTAWGLAAIDVTAFGRLVSAAGCAYASITTGTKALTDPTLPFALCHVGQVIHVAGAGAAGAVLVTTIDAVVSAGQVTLHDNAATTVAATDTSAGGLSVWGTAPGPVTDLAPLLLPDGTVAQPNVILFNGLRYAVVPVVLLACNEADVQSPMTLLSLVLLP